MCTDIMATTAHIATGHIMRSSFAASCPCRMIAILLASKLFFSSYERFAPWLDEHLKICVYTCKSCTDLKCLGTALKTKIIFPKKIWRAPLHFIVLILHARYSPDISFVFHIFLLIESLELTLFACGMFMIRAKVFTFFFLLGTASSTPHLTRSSSSKIPQSFLCHNCQLPIGTLFSVIFTLSSTLLTSCKLHPVI